MNSSSKREALYIKKRNPKNRHSVTVHTGADCPMLQGCETEKIQDLEKLSIKKCAHCFG